MFQHSPTRDPWHNPLRTRLRALQGFGGVSSGSERSNIPDNWVSGRHRQG